MSAHRLISTLLLLQQRGTVTAAEVADELEVSARTARRDLEALAVAGVPVYSRAGRGGGWTLIGGARTDLSGLHADEARALFLVAGPAAHASPELKSAVRKLVQALPESFRDAATDAGDAVVIDASRWGQPPRAEDEHLGELQLAVIDQAEIHLGYRNRSGDVSQRDVQPWGVVDKLGVWYLVAGTDDGRRTFRVDRVSTVERTGRPAPRPAGFDLEAEWRAASAAFVEQWPVCTAEILITPDAVDLVRGVGGGRCEIIAVEPDGRSRAMFSEVTAEAVAGRLAGFGSMVEVLGPPEVLDRLRLIAQQLAAQHLQPGSNRGLAPT